MLHPERQLPHLSLAKIVGVLKTAPKVSCRCAQGGLPVGLLMNEIGAIFHGDTPETADAEKKLLELLADGTQSDDVRYIAWRYLAERPDYSPAVADAIVAFENDEGNANIIAVMHDD